MDEKRCPSETTMRRLRKETGEWTENISIRCTREAGHEGAHFFCGDVGDGFTVCLEWKQSPQDEIKH